MFKKLILATALAVTTFGQSFGADFTKLVPEEADFILQINVSKIISMPEVQGQITDNFNKNPDQKKTYEELKSKTGFDPLKDINSLTFFSSGTTASNSEPLAGAFIEGKYDIEKIIKVIKEDKEAAKDVTVSVIDGFNTVLPKNPSDGCGIFLDDKNLAVGSQSGVDAIKKVKMGKAKSVENKKDFSALIAKLDTKATVSGAGLLPKSLKDKMAQNPQAQVLSKINFFRFDFNNDNGIIFNLFAEVDDAKNVNEVLTQVNGYVAMLRMFTTDAPEVAEILNLLQVSNENASIKLALNVPADKVQEIKKMLEERAKKLQGPNPADVNAPREK